MLKSIHIKYAGLAKAGMADASYTAQCPALMDAGADYIQINLATTGAVRLIEACTGQGYKGTFGLADGTVLASAMKHLPTNAKVFGVIDGFLGGLTAGRPPASRLR